MAPATLTGLLETAGPAAVPETLQQATIHAATLIAVGKTAVAGVATTSVAALVEGVLHEMSIEKLKLVLLLSLTLAVFAAPDGLTWSLATIVATSVWAAGLVTPAVIVKVAVAPLARAGTVQSPVLSS